jgi:hypothetical protein
MLNSAKDTSANSSLSQDESIPGPKMIIVEEFSSHLEHWSRLGTIAI